MLLKSLIEEFLDDGKYRKLAANTTRMYTDVLKSFEKHCKAKKYSEVSDITSGVLKEYALYLQEKGLKSGGIALQFRVIRAMLFYAEREEIETTRPFKKFQMPKIEKSIMSYVSFEEYESLMLAARGGQKPLRDTSIISLLFDTGMRIGELLNLTEPDILTGQGMLKVTGKTGSRIIPVSRSVIKRLREYQRVERPTNSLAPLFLTSTDESMTYGSVKLMLQRTFKRAGLKYKSPHNFRRGFATRFILNSGDVFSLQRILGHTTLVMSSRYAVLNEQSLKQVHLAASPIRR